MADPNDRWHDNNTDTVTIGTKVYSFYCDKECIFCSVCHEVAPDHFKMGAEEDHDVCYSQPKNDAELQICMEAMDSCPVDAIGCDGQEGEAPSFNRERFTDWDETEKLNDSDDPPDTDILNEWDSLFDDEDEE